MSALSASWLSLAIITASGLLTASPATAEVVRLSFAWNHSIWGIGGLLSDPPRRGFVDEFFSSTPLAASIEFETRPHLSSGPQDQPAQFLFNNLRGISVSFALGSYDIDVGKAPMGSILAEETDGRVDWSGTLAGAVVGPSIQSLAPQSLSFRTTISGDFAGFPSAQQFQNSKVRFGVNFANSQGDRIGVMFYAISAVPEPSNALTLLAGLLALSVGAGRKKALAAAGRS